MYGLCLPGAHGDHKKSLNSVELELEMVVSLQVGAGNQIMVLGKSNNLC